MSGGTQESQLRYYGEMYGKVNVAKASIERAHPGQAEAIFDAAGKKAHELIVHVSASVECGADVDNLRAGTYGALHEFLVEAVEDRDTEAADVAEAKARELGITDPDEIRIIRRAADDLFDVMTTMERDHWGG